MTRIEKPTVTFTDEALRVLRGAVAEHGIGADDVLRIAIDPRFQNDLFFGPVEPGDVVIEASGLKLAMDAGTSRRAHGLHIDYVDGPAGAGFKLDNPNQSPPVKGIRPADLARMLEGGTALAFIDARGPAERAKASVGGARPLDDRSEHELLALPKTTQLVFLGHHSRDGLRAAQRFFERGFTNVWYVVGGIDSWSTSDPSIPRYAP